MYIDYGYVHKITTSASLIYFFLVSSSFLNSEGGEIISRSSRASILPRTCSPVVPVSPSINTLYFAAKRLVVVDDDRRFDEGANPSVLGAQHSRIAAIESFIFSGIVIIELSKEQREKLSKSKRISNPGCYPTGFIGLTRPLVDAGMLKEGTPLTVNAISGYSGGGKAMMELFEDDEQDNEPWAGYGYSLEHKHLPEMGKYSLLNRKPIFQPQISTFAQGMVVSVPLHYDWLSKGCNGEKIHETLSKHYEGSNFVSVMPLGEANVKEAGLLERGAFLRPDTLVNTNKMELFVFPNDEAEQVVLCARLDNLGKGASGAAVQNLNIALGLDETIGLI